LKVLEQLYWLRGLSGVVAGILSTLYTYYAHEISTTIFSAYTFVNGLTIVLAIFLFTYYVFKYAFGSRIEKPTKLFSTGIGIYFIAWIVIWALLYTLIATVFV
jgi:hypothetical protein